MHHVYAIPSEASRVITSPPPPRTKIIVIWHMWVLGLESKSSARVENVLNCWAISLAFHLSLYLTDSQQLEGGQIGPHFIKRMRLNGWDEIHRHWGGKNLESRFLLFLTVKLHIYQCWTRLPHYRQGFLSLDEEQEGRKESATKCSELQRVLQVFVFDLVIPLWGRSSEEIERKKTDLYRELHNGFTQRISQTLPCSCAILN